MRLFRFYVCIGALAATMYACNKQITETPDRRYTELQGHNTNVVFAEAGQIDLGTAGAAEISAYDDVTGRLFVVNNSAGGNRVDVVDLQNAASPQYLGAIAMAPFGGNVNSVAAYDGIIAAAIEALDKTQPGKVLIIDAATLQVTHQVPVGALPDMVGYSPDGKYIVTANEGEPNSNYTIDPQGTVSIIEVENNYAVTTLNFESFEMQRDELMAKGLRVFGPGASLAQDLEPEYVAISGNSKEAWVTLQENNGIAHIDLQRKKVLSIYPLGFKDYSALNKMDASDQDGIRGNFQYWPVKGMYQPDGIAANPYNNTPFIYTANEGDAREYTGFVEAARVSSLTLDPEVFPNFATLKTNAQLGRLNVTTKLGNTDGDAQFEALYTFGGRSFSIWHGMTGELLYDSRLQVDSLTFANLTGPSYPENRNDDKGAEPEGITIGRVGNTTLLFVGLERADAILVYKITNPLKPQFLQWLNTGDAPEGILFVDGSKRSDGKALLIASSEEDGLVKIFTTQ